MVRPDRAPSAASAAGLGCQWLKNPGVLLVTRKFARCAPASYQELLVSHRYGSRRGTCCTARMVTAPSLPTVTTLESQYPPMPLVRWCADRNVTSRVFVAGTEGWAAAQPRLAP